MMMKFKTNSFSAAVCLSIIFLLFMHMEVSWASKRPSKEKKEPPKIFSKQPKEKDCNDESSSSRTPTPDSILFLPITIPRQPHRTISFGDYSPSLQLEKRHSSPLSRKSPNSLWSNCSTPTLSQSTTEEVFDYSGMYRYAGYVTDHLYKSIYGPDGLNYFTEQNVWLEKIPYGYQIIYDDIVKKFGTEIGFGGGRLLGFADLHDNLKAKIALINLLQPLRIGAVLIESPPQGEYLLKANQAFYSLAGEDAKPMRSPNDVNTTALDMISTNLLSGMQKNFQQKQRKVIYRKEICDLIVMLCQYNYAYKELPDDRVIAQMVDFQGTKKRLEYVRETLPKDLQKRRLYMPKNRPNVLWLTGLAHQSFADEDNVRLYRNFGDYNSIQKVYSFGDFMSYIATAEVDEYAGKEGLHVLQNAPEENDFWVRETQFIISDQRGARQYEKVMALQPLFKAFFGNGFLPYMDIVISYLLPDFLVEPNY